MEEKNEEQKENIQKKENDSIDEVIEKKDEEKKDEKSKEDNDNDINILGNIKLREKETLNELEMQKEIEEMNEKEMKNLKIIPKKDFIIVVVYNITPNVTEKHLKEIFSNYGEVRGVYIPKKGKTNLKENYAFIEFIKQENAEEAQLYMDEGQIDGKVVKVEILNPKNYIRIN